MSQSTAERLKKTYPRQRIIYIPNGVALALSPGKAGWPEGVPKGTAPAVIERSDVSAISAAGVVGEAVVSLVLADAFLEKFSGDSIGEIERNYATAAERLHARFTTRRS